MQENRPAIPVTLAEFNDLFGPPPILSSESADEYNRMVERFLECIRPRDPVELSFVRDIVDCTYRIVWYTHQKMAGIERQARRMKAVTAKRADLASRVPAIRTEMPEGQSQLIDALQDRIAVTTNSVREIDEILVTPQDHSAAFEATIGIHERIDEMLGKAIKRRNDAFKMMDLYSKFVSRRGQQLAQEMERAAAEKATSVAGQSLIAQSGVDSAPPIAPAE